MLPARQLPAHPPLFFTIRTMAMAQARRLCNIVLILVVFFVHADVSCVCTADTTRVFCLRTNLGLAFLFYVYICFWAHGVIWIN